MNNGFSLDEIPKYIRYDFLITLLRFICIATAWFFNATKKIEDGSPYTFALYLAGIPLIVWGLGEMFNSYKDERDLRRLQIILDKKDLFIRLNTSNLIGDRQLSFLINTIKNNIKNIIVEKKEEIKQQSTTAKLNQSKPPINT